MKVACTISRRTTKGCETSIWSAIGTLHNYKWASKTLVQGKTWENNESLHYIT